MKNKVRYLAPKGHRFNYKFMSVRLEDVFDFDKYRYCESHNLIFDNIEQSKKLYNAEPNIFTDERYHIDLLSNHPFLGKTTKAIKRRVRSMKNITGEPVRMYVSHRRYYPNKDIDLGLELIIQPSEPVEFELVRDPRRIELIKDEKIKELAYELFNRNFIVNVVSNTNFLIGTEEGGQIITCFGNNKMIGFSENNNSFRGYSNGCDNILYDECGEFDKWSRCEEISKEKSVKEIVKILCE